MLEVHDHHAIGGRQRRVAVRELQIIATRVFSLVFIVGGLLLAGAGFQALSRGYRSSGWPTTEGVVVSSEIEEDWINHENGRSKSYGAVVRYDYMVDGVRHSGDRVRALESWSSERSGAERVVERYPEGAVVDVYYDPETPGVSVLQPGVSTVSFVAPAMGVVFFGVGVLWLVLTPRLLRTRRAE